MLADSLGSSESQAIRSPMSFNKDLTTYRGYSLIYQKKKKSKLLWNKEVLLGEGGSLLEMSSHLESLTAKRDYILAKNLGKIIPESLRKHPCMEEISSQRIPKSLDHALLNGKLQCLILVKLYWEELLWVLECHKIGSLLTLLLTQLNYSEYSTIHPLISLI